MGKIIKTSKPEFIVYTIGVVLLLGHNQRVNPYMVCILLDEYLKSYKIVCIFIHIKSNIAGFEILHFKNAIFLVLE
jgi:hypothetical protein